MDAIPATGSLDNISLIQDGEETDVYKPDQGELVIWIPGINSIGQSSGSQFTWDGKNTSMQPVTPGTYYIKTSLTDQFGHVNTVVDEVQLLRLKQFVRLSLYNTAGEVVAKIDSMQLPSGKILLECEDTLYIGNNAPASIFVYDDLGSTLQWDGKNSSGRLVDSGIYELRLEVKTEEGYAELVSVKSVTVLKEKGGELIGNVMAFPNPCVAENGVITPMTINWSNKEPGSISAKVYNVAGELVRTITGKLDAPAGLAWDLMTDKNNYAASGLYIILIQARNTAGETGHKTVKCVIMYKYTFDDSVIN